MGSRQRAAAVRASPNCVKLQECLGFVLRHGVARRRVVTATTLLPSGSIAAIHPTGPWCSPASAIRHHASSSNARLSLVARITLLNAEHAPGVSERVASDAAWRSLISLFAPLRRAACGAPGAAASSSMI